MTEPYRLDPNAVFAAARLRAAMFLDSLSEGSLTLTSFSQAAGEHDVELAPKGARLPWYPLYRGRVDMATMRVTVPLTKGRVGWRRAVRANLERCGWPDA